MFLDRGQSFNGLKHLTEKVTAVAALNRVRAVADHTIPILLQRSTKLKISHGYFNQCLYPLSRIKTSSSVKIIFSKHFSTYFFTRIHLMKYLSSVVNLIAVTSLLLTSVLYRYQQRIFKNNTNYFYAVRISISLAILSEIFFQIGYFF